MADIEGQPPTVRVTQADLAFTIQRALHKRPWGTRGKKNVDSIIHQVAAEALAEAIMADGLIVSRPAPPALPRSTGGTWPQGEALEHPADCRR